MPRETPAQRKERALKALAIYQEPNSVREVADRMNISYGTAYSLIKLGGGGDEVFRKRGTRIRREEE